ncbi:MAG: PEP-utilizing enzyme [Actinomycetota bacterium]
MTTILQRLVDADMGTLAASMLAPGLTEDGFARLGIDFVPRDMTIDARGLSSERSAGQRLADAVDAAAADTGFFPEFAAVVDAGTAELDKQARQVAGVADQQASAERLVRAFEELAEAARSVAPAVAAAPVVRDRLKRTVAERLAGADEGLVEQLAWAGPPPAAVEAIHDCYRIALRIAEHAEAAEAVRELSGKGALRRLQNDYPALHRMVAEHVERFGWVRAQSGAVSPMTARELVQRITIALVRWSPEQISTAAGPESAVDVESLVGGSLPKELAGWIELLQQLTTGGRLGAQVIGRAQGRAWPYLVEAAARLGCEPVQLVFSAAGELQDALSGRRPLPLEEIDRRRREGFLLRVADGSPPEVGGPAPVQPLLGQTGSMGRALGRARILLDADEGARLKPGDVLVTHLSTPTYEGEPSLFPYRTVPSVAIEKAAAVVTDEGGLLSHAGIICRENSVPSMIGVEGASSTLIDGQVVEVDATKGAGRIIVWSCPLPPPEVAPEL